MTNVTIAKHSPSIRRWRGTSKVRGGLQAVWAGKAWIRYIAVILVATLLACWLTGCAAWAQSTPPPGIPPDAPPPGPRVQGLMTEPPVDMPSPPPKGSGLPLMQYRLGDSPMDEAGMFAWTKPEAMKDWNRMPMPPGPKVATEYAWFMTMIPVGPTGKLENDPYMLFKNAQYEFEVYSGSDFLFRYGQMQEGETTSLPNKPVFLSLEGHSPDKPLFIRLHSQRDSVIAGKIGPVLYGSQAELKLDLIKEDVLNGLSLFIFFIIGLVCLLMYFIHRDIPANLYFALFSLALCCNQLFSLRSLVFFWDIYSLRMYTEDLLHGVTLYLAILYFIHVLKPVFESLIHGTGLVLLAAGVVITIVRLLSPVTFEKYSGGIAAATNMGFFLLCTLCLTIIALSFRRQQVINDAKWFIAGFSLYLIINMIGYPLRLFIERNMEFAKIAPLEFIQVLNNSLDYSLLFSTFFFGIISFKRYAEVYRATRNYNRQLASWNQTLEWKVKERTQAIQNLLDHAGQGFLTFNEQLIVQAEYSIECHRLFQKDISGLRYVDLLYPNDAAEQALCGEILDSVFQEDELRRDVILSLLTEEAEVLGKRVALQYKWIPGLEASCGSVLVIITDITARIQLETQMVQEKQVLQMVVWATKHYRDFKNIVEEFRTFALEGLNELLCREIPEEIKWAELSGIVHTFKGNFAQIDFMNTAEGLHRLESQLTGWIDAVNYTAKSLTPCSLKEWLGDARLLEWLEKDLRILRDILGDRFDSENEVVSIELDRLRHFERLVQTILPEQEARIIIMELQKLQYRRFSELLDTYPEYTAKLAERTGKEIYPIRIIGGDMLVNPDRYAAFARTLIHVFRNMIDHGIETPEERASVGKERRGTIGCAVSGNEQQIQIRLSNNGREMNLMEIKNHALDKEICTEIEFNAMTTEEQLMLIFRERFTTRNTISELSGRGIGLSAVREALDQLKGTVRIESSAEHGTSFLFELPQLD
ncbi:ATP-binding protein [Paenibacillus thalictri]|uniref:histidine kinase n=1 Tax=Paenibacillus thalictri TaxID=2527873 RepID=A0A4Q9DI18_9BACL|nr:ATP-binding protein [Paenibacillus thalictri]TBL72653.1 hypothetical protein EYB31_28280 [Paenibacillus thalictri]